MTNKWFHSNARDWLLDHVPDWYLSKVWYPIFEWLESRK